MRHRLRHGYPPSDGFEDVWVGWRVAVLGELLKFCSLFVVCQIEGSGFKYFWVGRRSVRTAGVVVPSTGFLGGTRSSSLAQSRCCALSAERLPPLRRCVLSGQIAVVALWIVSVAEPCAFSWFAYRVPSVPASTHAAAVIITAAGLGGQALIAGDLTIVPHAAGFRSVLSGTARAEHTHSYSWSLQSQFSS